MIFAAASAARALKDRNCAMEWRHRFASLAPNETARAPTPVCTLAANASEVRQMLGHNVAVPPGMVITPPKSWKDRTISPSYGGLHSEMSSDHRGMRLHCSSNMVHGPKTSMPGGSEDCTISLHHFPGRIPLTIIFVRRAHDSWHGYCNLAFYIHVPFWPEVA
jgi:hypothetical protein